MKDDEPQQEDVAGLFRKFGGDVAAYKEFAPAELPASAHPAVTPPMPSASVKTAPPAVAQAPDAAPAFVSPSNDPLAAAVASFSSEAAGPSALELLFARLDGRSAVAAPAAARGLMAHWRKPT